VHAPLHDLLVDGVIDGLAVLPSLVFRRRPIQNEIRATLWAIALSYVLAHVNRWFALWPAYPNFPSGHMTFASCVWTELVALDRRYAFAAVPALAVLGYELFHAGWQGRVDIAGGVVLGPLVMLALRRLWKL
jgi:hypothetical protein